MNIHIKPDIIKLSPQYIYKYIYIYIYLYTELGVQTIYTVDFICVLILSCTKNIFVLLISHSIAIPLLVKYTYSICKSYTVVKWNAMLLITTMYSENPNIEYTEIK